MANKAKVRGITIELGIDSGGLVKGLQEVQSSLRNTQKSFRDVNRVLKFDPSNTDLLKQKQAYLADAIKDTKKQIEAEEQALRELQNAGNADQTIEQQRALQRDLIETREKLKNLETQAKQSASVLGTQMQLAGQKMKDLGAKITGVGKSLTTHVTLPVLAAGTAAAKFASDYEENLNKVEAAFGDAAGGVKEWAKTATDSFGLSESAALEVTSQFGDMGTSMGLSTKEAADMATGLAGLAGDLSSFKNIGIDQAMTALNGVFTGETESLKKLGVVMTQTNLEKFAADQGKVWKSMSESEKVTLRYQYVLSRTKNAQGDYARTSDGAANSLRTFKATLSNLAVAFGKEVLPVITPFIQKMTQALKTINQMPQRTRRLIVIFAGLAASIGPVVTGLGQTIQYGGILTQNAGKLITKLAAQQLATEGAAAATGLLNASMLANPAVLLIGGLIALTAALAFLAKKYGVGETSVVSFNNEMRETVEDAKQSREALHEAAAGVEEVKNAASDSLAETQAAADLAERYGNELADLADKSSRTTAEQQRMKVLVDELNTIYPELGLSIDETTGNLNQNSDALKQNIQNLNDQAKALAYQKIYSQYIDQLVELEKKKIETEQKADKLREKQNAVQLKTNGILIKQEAEQRRLTDAQKKYNQVLSDSTATQADVDAAMNELTQAQAEASDNYVRIGGELVDISSALQTYGDANSSAEQERRELSEAEEEADAAESELNSMINQVEASAQKYGVTLGGVAQATTEAGQAAVEPATIWANLSTEQQNAALNVQAAFNQMKDGVVNSLQSQMNMFEEYKASDPMNPDQLLANMQSQIDGVTNWEQNLNTLVDRGINQDLLQTLAAMGPEGAGYVQTFVNMSTEQLDQANTKWLEGLNIQGFTNEAGIQLGTGAATLAAGGADAFTQVGVSLGMSAEEAGQMTGAGLAQGISDAISDAENAGEDLGQAGIDGTKKGAGVNSPSWKSRAAGVYVGQGFNNGLLASRSLVKNGAQALGNAADIRSIIGPHVSAAQAAGAQVSAGLANGILAGRAAVINAAVQLASSAIMAARQTLQINSPSRVFYWMGEMSGEGFKGGLSDSFGSVTKTLKAGLNSMANYRPPTLDLNGVYSAVKAGAKDAPVNIYLDGRQISRGLRGMGVSFSV